MNKNNGKLYESHVVVGIIFDDLYNGSHYEIQRRNSNDLYIKKSFGALYDVEVKSGDQDTSITDIRKGLAQLYIVWHDNNSIKPMLIFNKTKISKTPKSKGDLFVIDRKIDVHDIEDRVKEFAWYDESGSPALNLKSFLRIVDVINNNENNFFSKSKIDNITKLVSSKNVRYNSQNVWRSVFNNLAKWIEAVSNKHSNKVKDADVVWIYRQKESSNVLFQPINMPIFDAVAAELGISVSSVIKIFSNYSDSFFDDLFENDYETLGDLKSAIFANGKKDEALINAYIRRRGWNA